MHGEDIVGSMDDRDRVRCHRSKGRIKYRLASLEVTGQETTQVHTTPTHGVATKEPARVASLRSA
jgi:hypothetical protein